MTEFWDAPLAALVAGLTVWLLRVRPMARLLGEARDFVGRVGSELDARIAQDEAHGEELRALGRRLADVEAAADDSQQRAMRYFGCIETIERERNEWQAAYDQAVAGHARAQEMLLGELSRMGRRLDKARKALEDSPPHVEAALALVSTQPKDDVLALPAAYKRTHDPGEGVGSRIERPALDLTPDEARQRESRDHVT